MKRTRAVGTPMSQQLIDREKNSSRNDESSLNALNYNISMNINGGTHRNSYSNRG